MEMIFRFYFHFKLLPALENRRERERESIATSPSADIIGWRGSADRDRRFDLCAIAIDASRKRIDRDSNRAKRRLLQSRSRLRLSGFDDFFYSFVYVLRNE